jgi:aminopeptidase N
MLPSLALSLAASLWFSPQAVPADARTHYDVLAYDLQLAVEPESKTLEGVATVTARSLIEGLAAVQLDLHDLHELLEVSQGGAALEVERGENSFTAKLAQPLALGTEFSLRVHYRGQPVGGSFDGFHWAKSADGSPWINTACQGLGAHYWYPCKASFFHPEDKPERVSMAIVCPRGLYGVSNGRLVDVQEGAPEWFRTRGQAYQTYRWRHDYPLETYSVTLNVGPYVVVESELEVAGLAQPVPFIYYVLPENAEKAALQFAQVPELVRIYSEAFGPFPFPGSKFGLVETNFWGMEHSTAVAYGSSYPAWCAQEGEKDRYAGRNRWFDYILVHEVAHEWWGNAVSAEHWGHFWIHEGFGTYAEGVYVEKTKGRAEADRFFAEQGRRISSTKGSLYRGDSPTSGEAYSGLIYSKGACVLNTLRHCVDDDAAWWRSLREFNLEYRYKNATTEGFRAVLERNTQREWKRFFDEWVYGEGTPQISGEIRSGEEGIVLSIDNSHGAFLVPLDLTWQEAGAAHAQRLWIEPGQDTRTIPCASEPTELRVLHLERLLGKHDLQVAD